MALFHHSSGFGESCLWRPSSLHVKVCEANAYNFHQDRLGDARKSVTQWLVAAVTLSSYKSHQSFPPLQVCPIITLPSQLHHLSLRELQSTTRYATGPSCVSTNCTKHATLRAAFLSAPSTSRYVPWWRAAQVLLASMHLGVNVRGCSHRP
jgi:hypothetical protein